MARCSGCGADRCHCNLQEGSGIGITGHGTPNEPFLISALGGEGGPGVTAPGTIVMYGGSTPPQGWLVCDGRVDLPTATYPDLFTAIGYTFGGSGAFFGLPDLSGRFPLGEGGGYVVGGAGTSGQGGTEMVSLSLANIPPHTHSINHDHGPVNSSTESDWHYHGISHDHPAVAVATDSQGAHQHTVEITTQGPGQMNRLVAGASGATTDSGGPISSSGLHFHHVTVPTPAIAGMSGAQDRLHLHSFDLPPFAGTSGAGQGVSQPFSNMPPYQTVRFIIAT